MPVTSYSTSAANNSSAPPNGAPEGWAPSNVNNTIRQIMADIAVEAQVNAVKVLASVAGTDTITGSMTPDLTAYSTGMKVVFTPANGNTGAATLNIDSLGAKSIVKGNGSSLVSGDLATTVPAELVYDGTNFVLINPLRPTFTALTVGTGGVTSNGSLTTPNTASDEVGFKGIPQNPQSGNYTLLLTDASKDIVHSSGDGAGDTYTIPANASVAFPIGTVVCFTNLDSNSVSIAITSDTLTLSGTTSTGTRTLAQNGEARARKVTSTGWIISGTGLT